MLGLSARCLFGSLARGRNENVFKNLIRADKKIATRGHGEKQKRRNS